MKDYTIDNDGLEFIKEFEGCSLTAYKCPAGVWTISYGITGEIDGVAIHEGMTITQKQADDLFIEHLQPYIKAVNKLDINMNQKIVNAMISFCYNLGTGIFTGTLLKSIEAEDWEDVARQVKLYNKARVNGVLTVLNGLTRRRNAEAEMILEGYEEMQQENAVDEELANAVSKIIKSGVSINFNQWKRKSLIKLTNVPALISKLGGLDKLVEAGVISNEELWREKQYNVNHVRSLLIKYSTKL